MRVLALDFDGVISDSAGESFLVALRTYTRLRPDSRFASVAEDLNGAPRSSILAHPVFRDFLGIMPLGNRAEDFAVALGLLEAGRLISDQSAYDLERSSQPEDFLSDFHAEFYIERERLCEANREGWLALLGPYPEFIELLARRAGDVELALATAKDRPSVDLLLRAYGIDGLFASDRILDKETGVDKSAHLRALGSRTEVAFEEITFIDDKVNHLDSVARLGVRCGLATWGYNGARERTLAEDRGHMLIDLEGAERQLFE